MCDWTQWQPFHRAICGQAQLRATCGDEPQDSISESEVRLKRFCDYAPPIPAIEIPFGETFREASQAVAAAPICGFGWQLGDDRFVRAVVVQRLD